MRHPRNPAKVRNRFQDKTHKSARKDDNIAITKPNYRICTWNWFHFYAFFCDEPATFICWSGLRESRKVALKPVLLEVD